MERLTEVYRRAEVAGARAWMLQAIAFGVGQEGARYGDSACAALAKAFGCGKTLAFDLAGIYREILRPRLDGVGESARFELSERRFYMVALQVGRETRRPALEVLALAEEQRRRDPTYTARRFAREMLGGAPEPKVAGLLRRLARVSHGDLEPLAALDPEEWGAVLDGAAGVIGAARRRLSARTRAA